MPEPKNSLVIPVYRNAGMIEALITAIGNIRVATEGGLEVVFVVDGSPDDSRGEILRALAATDITAQVVDHSRNFGAFAAVRTGMRLARGTYIAVMAADLQEPPELVVQFFNRLATGEVDVVAGQRLSRDDRGDHNSAIYWRLYRRFVVSEIPAGGVDVFGCTAEVRDAVCSMESVHTSLIAQLFWVGFRREIVPYHRQSREGKSGWTLAKKLRYLADSVFAFSDLPVKVLWGTGVIGVFVAAAIAIAVIIGRIVGTYHAPGYAATVVAIVFFGSLNLIGLGIIGSYVWRAYATAMARPDAIVRDVVEYGQSDRSRLSDG